MEIPRAVHINISMELKKGAVLQISELVVCLNKFIYS